MKLFEGLRTALRSLRVNKLRASLTMLGIVIGIAAVISVVNIGLGGKEAVLQEMEKTGVNLFVLYVKRTGQQNVQENERFTFQDIESLKRALPQLKYLLPSSTEYSTLEVNQKREQAVVVGTTPDFAQLRKRELAKGRFFSSKEFEADRRVAVVDENLAANLFGAGNPIGQQIIIRNVSCRIIGVLQKDKSAFAQFDVGPQNYYTYLPWGTWSTVFQSQKIDQLEGSTYKEEDLGNVINSAKRILNVRHNVTGRYEAFNVQQLVQAANKITRILTSIIGFVAGISLLVGGIGIMNIMLVSVTERTREIGLRKAVGAREKDILLQFLFEATVLSLMGGMFGIFIGIGSAVLVSQILDWPLIFSGWAILFAVTFSVGIGLFFGFYPAWKAAKLEPITALRYE